MEGLSLDLPDGGVPAVDGIRVGIGGWTFAPWRDNFYPKGLVQRRELEYAATVRSLLNNEAMAQIDALSREKLEAVGGGMNIPGLL